jgi:hypothetical protein
MDEVLASSLGLGWRVLTLLLLPGSRLSIWLECLAVLSRWRRSWYKSARGAAGGALGGALSGGLALLLTGWLARRCETHHPTQSFPSTSYPNHQLRGRKAGWWQAGRGNATGSSGGRWSVSSTRPCKRPPRTGMCPESCAARTYRQVHPRKPATSPSSKR